MHREGISATERIFFYSLPDSGMSAEGGIFMKKKLISMLTAGVMAVAAMPLSVCSVAAADSAYEAGDVDRDGIITGHDATVVSRYLYVDPDLLDAEQLELADMNGDGVVDQTDADLIYAAKKIAMGDVTRKNYETIDGRSAAYILSFVQEFAKDNIEVVNTLDGVEENHIGSNWNDGYITQVDFNLLDFDGNGILTNSDSTCCMAYGVKEGAGLIAKPYADGRYDMNLVTIFDPEPGDVDVDGYITEHDAAMITRFLYEDPDLLPKELQNLGDVNGDGGLDQADADLIMENAEYYLGDSELTGKKTSAAVNSKLVANQMKAYAEASLQPLGNMGEHCTPHKGASYIYAGYTYKNPVCKNLMDLNADGVVDLHDVMSAMICSSRLGSGVAESPYFIENRYDIDFSQLS